MRDHWIMKPKVIGHQSDVGASDSRAEGAVGAEDTADWFSFSDAFAGTCRKHPDEAGLVAIPSRERAGDHLNGLDGRCR